eukprot:5566388-Prymnesium_polylepis.1
MLLCVTPNRLLLYLYQRLCPSGPTFAPTTCAACSAAPACSERSADAELDFSVAMAKHQRGCCARAHPHAVWDLPKQKADSPAHSAR